MAVNLTNVAPPRCEKHDEQMVLSFYKSYSTETNWVCRSCREEYRNQQTRFPEGAEL